MDHREVFHSVLVKEHEHPGRSLSSLQRPQPCGSLALCECCTNVPYPWSQANITSSALRSCISPSQSTSSDLRGHQGPSYSFNILVGCGSLEVKLYFSTIPFRLSPGPCTQKSCRQRPFQWFHVSTLSISSLIAWTAEVFPFYRCF